MNHDYGKPIEGFNRLTTSLEHRDPDLGTTETPTERFFVCSASEPPAVNIEDWRLVVEGDAVAEPVTVDHNRLGSLPQVEMSAWLECAGNGRTMFTEIDGLQIPAENAHTHWSLRGMGQARWRGPRLRDVLALATVDPDAEYVAPVGLDCESTEGEPASMCLPRDKATAETTIVATHMNGEPLLPAHGAPARLLVPGWVGAYSMKWLGRVVVSKRWVPSWRADHYYVDRTPDGTITGPVTSHPVKSNLALPYPATVPAGSAEILGYARSGAGPITEVSWSLDNGPWHPAVLDRPISAQAWTVFRVSLDLSAGEHILRTRATDSTGAAQPHHQPFHPYGVLWHSVIPHRITAG